MTRPPQTPRSARPAPDLEDAEQAVQGWFDRLARAEAPQGLRARILDVAARAAPPARSATPAGRRLGWRVALHPRRLTRSVGGWGLASAALLLLALGAAVVVELTDPGPAVEDDTRTAAQAAADLAIAEDESLALYHGVETFDEVGLAPGELIADWGR